MDVNDMMATVARHFPWMGWRAVTAEDGCRYVCTTSNARPDQWAVSSEELVGREVAEAEVLSAEWAT